MWYVARVGGTMMNKVVGTVITSRFVNLRSYLWWPMVNI